MANPISEAGSRVEAAAQAAASGDYASAEHMLREAARMQELQLGQEHPNVAITLNNLAVVCEIRQKPEEAERCYRRAFAIATAALGSHHPSAVTSGDNLKAFCQAHGKAVDVVTLDLVTLPEPLLGREAREADVASIASPAADESLAAVTTRPAAVQSRTYRGSSRAFEIWLLAAILLALGLVGVFLMSGGRRFAGKSPDLQEPSSTTAAFAIAWRRS
jgi:hypothetical protein